MTIILQAVPAYESSGMVFARLFEPAIEMQQAQSLLDAERIAHEMIARAKESGTGASLICHVFGRKPHGWATAKRRLALNTF